MTLNFDFRYFCDYYKNKGGKMDKIKYLMDKVERIDDELGCISDMSNQIEENASLIGQNASRIDENATKIAQNSSQIEISGGKIASNTAQIGSNFNLIKKNRKKLTGYNYLINSNFLINQRKATSYTNSSYGNNKYTVDRLIHLDSNSYTLTPQSSGGIKVANSSSSQVKFGQYIERGAYDLGGKPLSLTISCDGVEYKYENFVVNAGESAELTFDSGAVGVEYISNSKFCCYFKINAGKTVLVNYWKLEIGEMATRYEPRFIGEELYLCHRYYRDITSYIVPGILLNSSGEFTINLNCNQMRVFPTITLGRFANWIRGNGKLATISSSNIISFATWTEGYEGQIDLFIRTSNVNFSSQNFAVFFDILRFIFDAEIY